MNWVVFHTKSERYALQAHEAKRQGTQSKANRFFAKAAELEGSAFNALDVSKARTRGVTAVSAASLWFKAGKLEDAERFAFSAMADDTLPSFARDELRVLLQSVWTEAAKRQARVGFLEGQVLVSVKGGDVVTGGAPLEMIVEKVQTIQAMFYRTIELLRGEAHRRIGRPAKDIIESCRPWLFQQVPGSYQFSVAIQKPAQKDFFRQDIEPDAVASQFLKVVQASCAEDPEVLKRVVPDDAYRKTFLELARSLSPRDDSFERIEFRAVGDSVAVSVDAIARQSIGRQLKGKRDAAKAPVKEAELRGVLRAVHLDKDWLEVHVDRRVERVGGLQDAVDDVIGPMVNREVIIRVRRHSPKKLVFVDIDLAD